MQLIENIHNAPGQLQTQRIFLAEKIVFNIIFIPKIMLRNKKILKIMILRHGPSNMILEYAKNIKSVKKIILHNFYLFFVHFNI